MHVCSFTFSMLLECLKRYFKFNMTKNNLISSLSLEASISLCSHACECPSKHLRFGHWQQPPLLFFLPLALNPFPAAASDAFTLPM